MFTIIIIFVVLIVLFVISIFFVVDQQTVAIIERFGKFKKAATTGLNMKIPLIDKIRGRISLRIQQLDVPVETKTKDNVFVKVAVSVQFFVMENKIFQAYYKFTNPASQIQSFVFDVVRAKVPGMSLDDVFEKKDDIALAVKSELSELMEEFGYGIVKALVTDIDPDDKVKKAMNEINEAQRLRVAAQERGEAEKILKIKAAEAESESMRLRGLGVALQRKAIIDGLKQSVDGFAQSLPGIKPEEVMSLVLVTQYFDTLKEIGANNRSSTILLSPSPKGLQDIAEQLREGIITANLVTEKT
jgi:regulator of protease activity HflC (stomatin/prohibitin superfamily)